MTEYEEDVLTRLDAQLALLTQIRDLLAYAGTPEALAGVEADSSVCPHPEDRRISLTAMGEVHWKCRECQYEYRLPR
jgi:hypothetical protein